MKEEKFEEEIEIKFWKNWLKVDHLKRQDLVKELPILKRLSDENDNLKGTYAILLNSYFEDLESEMKNSNVKK